MFRVFGPQKDILDSKSDVKNTKNASEHRKNIDICQKGYPKHVRISYNDQICDNLIALIFGIFGPQRASQLNNFACFWTSEEHFMLKK